LHIAAVTTAAESFVPGLIRDYSESHGEVEVQLSVGNRSRVNELIAEHRADVAFAGRPPRDPRIRADPVRANELVLVGAPGIRVPTDRRLRRSNSRATRGCCASRARARRVANESFLARHQLGSRTLTMGQTAPSSRPSERAWASPSPPARPSPLSWMPAPEHASGRRDTRHQGLAFAPCRRWPRPPSRRGLRGLPARRPNGSGAPRSTSLSALRRARLQFATVGLLGGGRSTSRRSERGRRLGSPPIRVWSLAGSLTRAARPIVGIADVLSFVLGGTAEASPAMDLAAERNGRAERSPGGRGSGPGRLRATPSGAARSRP